MTIIFDNPAENALAICIEALIEEATSFSCTEVQALYEAYKHMGYDETAAELLRYHSEGDDEGDMHAPIYADDGLTIIGVDYNPDYM